MPKAVDILPFAAAYTRWGSTKIHILPRARCCRCPEKAEYHFCSSRCVPYRPKCWFPAISGSLPRTPRPYIPARKQLFPRSFPADKKPARRILFHPVESCSDGWIPLGLHPPALSFFCGSKDLPASFGGSVVHRPYTDRGHRFGSS